MLSLWANACLCSASHVVGHLRGNLHRKLDDACDLAILAPRRLIDELFYALFFDGVDVGLASRKDMLDDAHGALLVAAADVFADERLASPRGKSGGRFLVHREDDEIAVDDRDAHVEFICPVWGNIFP